MNDGRFSSLLTMARARAPLWELSLSSILRRVHTQAVDYEEKQRDRSKSDYAYGEQRDRTQS